MQKLFYLLPLLGAQLACSSVQPRAALSSYGCMQAAIVSLPIDVADKRLHCVASARITRQCSLSEAYMAGIGKELRDAFTGGDVEWADWQADRAGMQCGREHADESEIQACCAQRGY